ncbi:MAG TPA: hypothetical protein VI455_19130 [Terriglobia bacterium]
MSQRGETANIPKSDVLQVFYVRDKPLSDTDEYWLHEGGPIPAWLFDPTVWPYVFHIGVKIPAIGFFDARG